MRIPCLHNNLSAVRLTNDTRTSVVAHRRNAVNHRRVEDYRLAHRLCQVCLVANRIAATRQVHHMQRLSEGGGSEQENLLACCLPCHGMVDDLPLEEQQRLKAQAEALEAGGDA